MDRMTQESLLAGAMSDQDAQAREWLAARLDFEQDGKPVWTQPQPEELTDNPELARLTRLARAVEAELIPRLIRGHRDSHCELPTAEQAARQPTARPTSEEFELFVVRLMTVSDEELMADVALLRARGVRLESIHEDLLGGAARRYGKMWDEDECDFTDVTVAVGRLQQIMRALSTAFLAEGKNPLDGRRVLLLPAVGEQHTFGLSMVAAFFRREGWHVLGATSAKPVDPSEAVANDWLDLVGISAGVESRLDWLTSMIACMRESSRNPGVKIIVGGPIFLLDPSAVGRVGADGAASDGGDAVRLAHRLLSSETQRSER